MTPCGVATDAAHVYWGNTGSTTIGRAALNGTGATQRFITGATGPCGLTIAGGYLYWANIGPIPAEDGTTIGRAKIDGSGVTQRLVDGATAPCGVAVG